MRLRMASSTAKRAVAFVQMKNAGRDAQGLQRAEAADAEQQFLANAGARVAAVEPRSQLAILGGVAFDVGIEQEQIAAADVHAPDLGEDGVRCACRSGR